MTPLPSIRWYETDNDGEPLPKDERCWWLTFDVGTNYIDIQLFPDGTCEWFAIKREGNDARDPRGNDRRQPFQAVADDPAFRQSMEAIRRGYDSATTQMVAPEEKP